MAVDTPARIAVLGAGPIGLETALYARYLGYEVDLYERGAVAESVRRWGQVRMFTPFGMNRSPLGLAALAAQDASYRPPADDALLTGEEYRQAYLLPLAQSDLLMDGLRLQTQVLGIGRQRQLKGDSVGKDARYRDDFRLSYRDAHGKRKFALADVVVDCTGVYRQANWLGRGGLPAFGETALRKQIVYHLPDPLGAERAAYAGRHTLVVGSGYSAATTVVALAELARSDSQTRVTWVTRHARGEPITPIADDRLPERAALTRAANALADSALSEPGATVRRLARTWAVAVGRSSAGGFRVRLSGAEPGVHEFDRVVALVGYRPDVNLFRELQVQLCYASEGPMKLASALAQRPSADCLSQPATSAETILTTEPDFYILGAKSYGRSSAFLLQNGLEQIRQLFSIVGDRADLNLYAAG